MIESYLKHFSSFAGGKTAESLVLLHGKPMTPKSLDQNKYKRVRKTVKECYKNAFELVTNYPDLVYCEGFAMKKTLPIAFHHAWVIDTDGMVIDPTWSDSVECEYYGIPIETDRLYSFLCESKQHGVLTNSRDLINRMGTNT